MKAKASTRASATVLALVLVMSLVMWAQQPFQALGVTIPKTEQGVPAVLDTQKYPDVVQLPVTLYDYGAMENGSWETANPTILNQNLDWAYNTSVEPKDYPSTMRFWDASYARWNGAGDPSSFLGPNGEIMMGGCFRWGMFNRMFGGWSNIIESPSRDLFGKSDQSCMYGGKVFKRVYENVLMDFAYNSETNTYHFSSNESKASFDGSNRISKTDFSANDPDRQEGFWPFGYGNVHFGMGMDFNFYLPSQAYLDNNEYYFAFSGDDDLVVYLDGKLALDLGGAHSAVPGYIDFAHKIVVYGGSPQQAQEDSFLKYVEISGIPFHRDGFAEAGVNWNEDTIGYVTFEDLGIDLDNSATHNFKLAYLERGGDASNLTIEMNMEIRANVNYKVVGSVSPDPEKTDALPVENSELYPYDQYTALPVLNTTDEGYSFSGWYSDPECTKPWVDGTELTSVSTTLYGKWDYGKAEKKSVPESGSNVLPGQQISYTVTYKNENDVPEKVVISDDVPIGTELVDRDVLAEDGNVSITQQDDGRDTVSSTWSELQPGETASMSFTVTVLPQSAGTTIVNSGNATVNDGQRVYVTNITEHEVDDLKVAISKVSDPESGSNVQAGQTITYTVTASNESDHDMESVVITDAVPEYLTYVDGSATCPSESNDTEETGDVANVYYSGDSVVAKIPKLESGGSVDMTFKATVNSMNEGEASRDIVNKALLWSPTIEATAAEGEGSSVLIDGQERNGAIGSNETVHHQVASADTVSPVVDPDDDEGKGWSGLLPKTGDPMAQAIPILVAAIIAVSAGIAMITRTFVRRHDK